MMDSERPHRTGSTSSSSELFICFTSRLSSSSSSLKLSSKSIPSPGRARDPPAVSLSNSLSRRLRSNGSMKGGQASPMFPTGSKKRGCGFDNPEPSSPKVTCIGQVRVKTKKQGKKMRTLSKRRGGEVSFRKIEQAREGGLNHSHSQSYQTNANNQFQHQHQHQQQECLPHRNQRWVHLPLTICEALRAFGAEFSCLFPCRSSCFSTSEREKEEKTAGSNGGERGQSSCGVAFARWLVALQEGEGGKGRELELVAGREEERTELTEITLRRHAVDEVEIRNTNCDVKNEVVEEDEARVSICVPPKNALLLMRCRSDPMRMSALANRFWESPAPKDEEGDDEEEECDDQDDKNEEERANLEHGEMKDQLRMEDREDEVCKMWVSDEACGEQKNQEAEAKLLVEVPESQEQEENPEEKLEMDEELQEEIQEEEVQEVTQIVIKEENVLDGSYSEVLVVVDEESSEYEEKEERRASHSSSIVSVHSDSKDEEDEREAKALGAGAGAEKSTVEKETQETLFQEEEKVTQERFEPEEETQENYEDEEHTAESEERESSVLPDCLLLMMCEPKLSMEVSKETWVCSTDFIRLHPQKKVDRNPKDGSDDPKNRVSIDSNPAHRQPVQLPPRSSCSLPAAEVSMATMIEQKLVNAVGYEPFVLTRCKSEPMRTAAKLAPEACSWKDRKIEPLRRGVGAAGVGF